MLKLHGTGLIQYVGSHPRRKVLWLEARRRGQRLRQAHTIHEDDQMRMLQEDLAATNNKLSVAKKLLKRAKAGSIVNHARRKQIKRKLEKNSQNAVKRKKQRTCCGKERRLGGSGL